jgi:four helix bundle protein
MNSEELKTRTKQFAHRCVKFAISLPNTDLGRTIRRQLIRCATSTAANYRAVCLAQTHAVFAAKLSTVLEEADESWFWIEFAVDEDLAERERVSDLLNEAKELTLIFSASRKTASTNQ